MLVNNKSRRASFVVLIFGIIIGFFLLMLSQQAVEGISADVSADGVWQEVAAIELPAADSREAFPETYRLLRLNEPALQAILAQAPREYTPAAENESVVLTLPLPAGGYGRFRMVLSPIMAPALNAKFPTMQTYAGHGLDDKTATMRLSWTQFGLHVMILSAEGTTFIDPYSRADIDHYLVYKKDDFAPLNNEFIKYEPLGDKSEIEALVAKMGGTNPSGDELRIYRLALAATGEYTQFHGGTVPDGMAAIVVAMNRVNGIYERDVAIRMELIANNDAIVYTNGATDPYTNNSGGTMLGENQANLDTVIGDANYDIGHVFSTGGGGIASLGVPCRSGLKARGVTGLSSPIGDVFYVDYVSHEMGHQFGANHTFNGNAGACAGGNRHGPTAYEPGSATTIMGYAGICSDQNIQPNSDDYFHGISFDEIVAYSTVGLGNSCPQVLATGNDAPVVDAGGDFTIPLDTPFVLNGSATDPNSDPLTFGWEEFDLGPAGHPNFPVGNAPIFRSFTPVTDTFRIFPQISDIVNNTQTIGEILPSYARTMNFRLTARDNHVSFSAGGVDYDMMQVEVTDLAGPFLVTEPNTAVTWLRGTLETVTWDVAGTDQAPVNCANVDITLSTDGGYTYPLTLLAGTANDGSAEVVVPDVPTSNARVSVACSDNIFFDISNQDFTILDEDIAILAIDKSVVPTTTVLPGEMVTYTIQVANSGNITATTMITDNFEVGLTDPVCNGVSGDLQVTEPVGPLGQVAYACTAVVAESLAVALDKTVDRDEVMAGEAVTFTITVTNVNAITLTNVVIDDPFVSGCSPDLGTPLELAPLAGQTYTCPNIVINEAVTNTALVTAEMSIANTAAASSEEAVNSPVTSETVVITAMLSAEDAVSVTIIEETSMYYLYLPVVLKPDA